MPMLIFSLLLCFSINVNAFASVPVQGKHVWVYVSDSKQKPLANIRIGILEWTVATTTDANGRARLAVSPSADLGSLITIVIYNKNFDTFDHRPFRTRIHSFNRVDQPIEITLQRSRNLLKSLAGSISANKNNDVTAQLLEDPYSLARRALSNHRFQEALQHFSKAYDIQRAIYERLHDSSSQNKFSQLCYYFGLTYYRLSRFDEARIKFEQAIQLQKNWFEPRYFLAEYFQVQGDYAKAEEQFKLALSLPRASSNPLALMARLHLADIYLMYGKFDEFKRRLRTALAPRIHKDTASPFSIIQQLEALISKDMLNAMQDSEKRLSHYVTLANTILNKAYLVFWEKEFGSSEPFLILFLNSLANNYMQQEKYELASKCYERAFDICKRVYGEIHTTSAAELLLMADLDEKQEKFNEAEEKYRRALQVTVSILGAQNPKVAEIHYHIGTLLARKHSYAQAEDEYRAALEGIKNAYGTKHPLFVVLLIEFAELEGDQNKYQDAVSFLEQALEIAKSLWGVPDSEGIEIISEIIDDLEEYYKKQGKSDQVHRLSEQKQMIAQLSSKPLSQRSTSHRAPIAGMNLRGGILSYMYPQDPAEGIKYEPLLRQALKVSDLIIKAQDSDFFDLLKSLSSIYYADGNYDQAKLVIQRAINSTQNALEADPLSTAFFINFRGLINHENGNYSEAEKDYRKSLAIFELQFGKNSQDLVPVLYNLGMVLADERKYQEARSILDRALAVREADEHIHANPDSITIVWKIANVLCETGEHQEAEARFKKIFMVISSNRIEEYASAVPILEDYAKCLRLMNNPAEAVRFEDMAKTIKSMKAKDSHK